METIDEYNARKSFKNLFVTIQELHQELEEKCNSEEVPDTSHLPWVEKFRPSNWDDIISQTNVVDTFKSFIENGTYPNLLISGPPGTGKTSTVEVYARKLYGVYYGSMVLNINASEERGVDVVRTKIRNFAMGRVMQTTLPRLVILDESDAMTGEAQIILASIIDKYHQTVRFCLMCNYIKKITPIIMSRCTILKFPSLNSKDLAKRLGELKKEMGFSLSKCGTNTVIKISRGDMRRVLNTLQIASMSYKKLTDETITRCIGYPQQSMITDLYHTLKYGSFDECYQTLARINNEGYLLNEIVNELTELILAELSQIKNVNTLIIGLARIELNLVNITNEKIQLTSIIGIFKVCDF